MLRAGRIGCCDPPLGLSPAQAATAPSIDSLMPLKDLPADARPREKLLARGPGALSDTELLALLLRTGTRGRGVFQMARELLAALRRAWLGRLWLHCRLPSRPRASHQAWAAPPSGPNCWRAGTRPARAGPAIEGAGSLRLARRREAIPAAAPGAAAARSVRRAVPGCAEPADRDGRTLSRHLDPDQRVPARSRAKALHHHAAALVLAHNHPSGTVQPSRADEALTQTLKAALALVDVRVLDHVIVAPGQALSMAEKGLL